VSLLESGAVSSSAARRAAADSLESGVVLKICCLVMPRLLRAKAGPEAALRELYSRIRSRPPESEQLEAALASSHAFLSAMLLFYPAVNLVVFFVSVGPYIAGSLDILALVVVAMLHSALLGSAAGLAMLRLRMLLPGLRFWTTQMQDSSILQPVAANLAREAYPGEELRLGVAWRWHRLATQRSGLAVYVAGLIRNFPAASALKPHLIARLGLVNLLIWLLLFMHLLSLGFLYSLSLGNEAYPLLGLILFPGLLTPLICGFVYWKLIFPGWMMREICLYNILKCYFGNENKVEIQD
jgi:hypothetical protein